MVSIMLEISSVAVSVVISANEHTSITPKDKDGQNFYLLRNGWIKKLLEYNRYLCDFFK